MLEANPHFFRESSLDGSQTALLAKHLQTYFHLERINNNSSYRLYNIFIGGPQTCENVFIRLLYAIPS
jgi:hypothetical protein